MFFRKNFPDGSMNFLNISHGENTEAQKGHRAALDFSILAAWRHQGKVASKIESHQKMKWYRENREAAAKAAGGAALRSFEGAPVKDDSLYKEK